jgi:LPXTG-motif cell wall-anchored protein
VLFRSDSVTGTRQAGWILVVAVAAVAIAGLVLAKVRKRRVP